MDKVLHLLAGVIIAGFLAFVAGPFWALGATVVAAGGKEAIDSIRHGKPDLLDALATIAGGLITVATIGLLQ